MQFKPLKQTHYIYKRRMGLSYFAKYDHMQCGPFVIEKWYNMMTTEILNR